MLKLLVNIKWVLLVCSAECRCHAKVKKRPMIKCTGVIDRTDVEIELTV